MWDSKTLKNKEKMFMMKYILEKKLCMYQSKELFKYIFDINLEKMNSKFNSRIIRYGNHPLDFYVECTLPRVIL